ncbi:transcriptional regulator [Paractinoplanes abujensis]|uniref:Transcriptional regulator with XRE-family HTH domain n=1 Tax=Paractinoplanes abujensis TaxID=882441 RepID=A0A7W7G017_9ACTN|nr:helix-turn-helix transcriptional regulator [Actinoplanes abujensis]MBB4692663.1 transcriptional regulator with XRE-family HTH domain [Actinoplanes abujensis]GID22836.1 transcriptional regulator [Actinoplanes abujensis]
MNQLGEAIRAWRSRLDPAAAGLAHHAPRRVPGLRRAELAGLAGISVEYVVQLEQGRAASPSAQVCSSLARALRLSADEHAHLMRLAGQPAGPHHIPRLVPDSLHRIIGQLDHNPTAVFDAVWQLLHWNPLFAATMGDPTRHTGGSRNAMIWQFEDEPTRVRHTEAERDAFEASLVADLRATSSRFPHDPEIPALITRLRRSSRFRALWDQPSVAPIPSSAKVVDHPAVGAIALDSNVLTTEEAGLRVLVYTPRPGTDARSKLTLLAAVGTQDLSAEQFR